eukprot:1007172-Rhodomonas_salina.2
MSRSSMAESQTQRVQSHWGSECMCAVCCVLSFTRLCSHVVFVLPRGLDGCVLAMRSKCLLSASRLLSACVPVVGVELMLAVRSRAHA